MPYSTLDRHNPSFYLFPTNNNRTAWKPINQPVILIAPHVKTTDGLSLERGQIENIRVYIEGVAQNAYVAGQDHILSDGTQLRYPARELYSEELDFQERQTSSIKLESQIFYDSANQELQRPPRDGDYFTYATGSGIHSTLPFYPDAEYYDLSMVLIDTENLPSGYYNLIYESTYYGRTVSTFNSIDDFICISPIRIKSSLRFGFDHPGQVLHEMYRYTPSPYLTSNTKANDSTIEFYRPFSDIINDVYDEQTLLKSINWVNKAPLEMVPYLAYLLGWELPYFPQTNGAKSLDAIRRAIIKNTVYFQNIKGSKKSIKEIFAIFGLDVLLENLWWSKDGKRLIRPNQTLPEEYQDQKITATETPQIDVLLNNFTTDNASEKIFDVDTNSLKGAYVDIRTNLVFIPRRIGLINLDQTSIDVDNVTIEAAVFRPDSTDSINDSNGLKSELDKAINNPATYAHDYGQVIETQNGLLSSGTLESYLSTAKARTRMIVGGSTGQIIQKEDFGSSALSKSASFNTRENVITFSYDGVLEPGEVLYAWVTYKRVNINIPEALTDLQSNRFDLQVLTKELQEIVDPQTLIFALDFLNKVKAFHSLLYLVRTSANLNENYECTDLKIAGTSPQRYENADLGRLQVPPAILPDVSKSCSTPADMGFKKADISFRLLKYYALQEEHIASYDLEYYGKDTNDNDVLRSSENPNVSRILPFARNEEDSIFNNKSGAFADYGQNIIIPDDRLEQIEQVLHPDPNANSQSSNAISIAKLSDDHNTVENSVSTKSTDRNSSTFGSFTLESRAKSPSMTFPLQGFADYTYKGRINDGILYRNTNSLDENFKFKTGPIFMGSGCYYAYPVLTEMTSVNSHYSGESPAEAIVFYNKSTTGDVLGRKDKSFLTRLLKSWATTDIETIHYHDGKTKVNFSQLQNQALLKPGLNIEKPNLCFPGCRMPSMNKLTDDYTALDIKARPWDDHYCGITQGSCKHNNNTLNAVLVYDEVTGSQSMTYDEADYIILGNSMDEDIKNLGYDQDDGVITTVHEVYNSYDYNGPYVSFENINNYASSAQIDSFSYKIFSSAEFTDPNYDDIKDGYFSAEGSFVYVKDFTDLYDEVLVGLGRPVEAGSGINVYYRCSSNIFDGSSAYRLDGNMLVISGSAVGDSQFTNLDQYLDQDGQYDFSPDQVNTPVRMVLVESVGAGQLYLNGDCDNMMSLI